MGDDVEIRAVETLSDKHFPFRMYSFAYRRRDGARQELRREVYAIGHGAVVLPFDPRRSTVLLTRQFRLPAHANGDPAWLVERCAVGSADGTVQLKVSGNSTRKKAPRRDEPSIIAASDNSSGIVRKKLSINQAVNGMLSAA